MGVAPLPQPLCRECNQPIVTDTDLRRGMCYSCSEDKRAFNRYQKVVKARVNELTAELAKPRINAPHTSELTEELIDLFGGVKGFAFTMHSCLMEAVRENPGGKVALDGMRAVCQLIKDSTAQRKTANDAEFLSDQDIERELEDLLGKAYPRLAIDVPSLPAPELPGTDGQADKNT